MINKPTTIKKSRALALGLVFLLIGCSTEKDTFVHRSYHNTTARYNGYYYAKLSINEGVEKIQEEFEDDYSQILPVFENGDEESAKGAYPQMDRAIEKSSKVIKLHSMDIRGEQKCKWIDDNYFLLGRAHFYKREWEEAEEMFKYVSKQFKDQPIRYRAMLWLTRTYMEKEQIGKARNILSLIKEDRDYPEEEFKEEYNEVEAELLIKTKKYKEAIKRLETAVEEKRWLLDRARKTRLLFILAQLYEKQRDIEKSNSYYSEVLKLSPTYEMSFYAKINRALSYEAGVGNSGEIKRQLQKMLRDEKNEEYFDQIYYALAQIELKQNNREKGIHYLKKSTQAEMSNETQKRKALLQLADLFFNNREYTSAQAYYDTTLSYITEEHQRYPEVETKSKSLTKLVENLDLIERQDSLIALAQMPDAERTKQIEAQIQKKLDEAEEKKRREEQKQRMIQQQGGQQQSFNAGPGQSGKFYFYNQRVKSSGHSEFQKRWGDRSLRDNWRLNSKKGGVDLADSDVEKDPALDTLESAMGVITDPKYYMKEIPLGEEEMKSARNKTAEALYLVGLIYREELEDEQLAIESFSRVVKDFDDTKYIAPALYQLYRLYLKKEERGSYFSMDQRSTSEYYKKKILEDFPDSEYARILKNPDYMEGEEKEKRAAERRYEKAYEQYSRGYYDGTVQACREFLQQDSLTHYREKFYLLKGLAWGKKEDYQKMKSVLDTVVGQFAETKEAERAKMILESLKTQGEGKKDTVQIEEKDPFQLEEDATHFFALVFDDKLADVNDVRSGISNFNLEYYSRKGLEVTNTLLPGKVNMLMVKSFKDKKVGMEYYRTFLKHASILDQLNEDRINMFVVSPKNFQILFRSQRIEEYSGFFEKNYLQ